MHDEFWLFCVCVLCVLCALTINWTRESKRHYCTDSMKHHIIIFLGQRCCCFDLFFFQWCNFLKVLISVLCWLIAVLLSLPLLLCGVDGVDFKVILCSANKLLLPNAYQSVWSLFVDRWYTFFFYRDLKTVDLYAIMLHVTLFQ